MVIWVAPMAWAIKGSATLNEPAAVQHAIERNDVNQLKNDCAQQSAAGAAEWAYQLMSPVLLATLKPHKEPASKSPLGIARAVHTGQVPVVGSHSPLLHWLQQEGHATMQGGGKAGEACEEANMQVF